MRSLGNAPSKPKATDLQSVRFSYSVTTQMIKRQMDPEGGFEPKPFTVPKTVVLPLDDSGIFN